MILGSTSLIMNYCNLSHTHSDSASVFLAHTHKDEGVAAPSETSCDPNNITDELRHRRLSFQLFLQSAARFLERPCFSLHVSFVTPPPLAPNHRSELIKTTKHL